MEEVGLGFDGGGFLGESGHLGLGQGVELAGDLHVFFELRDAVATDDDRADGRSEEHTSELQSPC